MADEFSLGQFLGYGGLLAAAVGAAWTLGTQRGREFLAGLMPERQEKGYQLPEALERQLGNSGSPYAVSTTGASSREEVFSAPVVQDPRSLIMGAGNLDDIVTGLKVEFATNDERTQVVYTASFTDVEGNIINLRKRTEQGLTLAPKEKKFTIEVPSRPSHRAMGRVVYDAMQVANDAAITALNEFSTACATPPSQAELEERIGEVEQVANLAAEMGRLPLELMGRASELDQKSLLGLALFEQGIADFYGEVMFDGKALLYPAQAKVKRTFSSGLFRQRRSHDYGFSQGSRANASPTAVRELQESLGFILDTGIQPKLFETIARSMLSYADATNFFASEAGYATSVQAREEIVTAALRETRELFKTFHEAYQEHPTIRGKSHNPATGRHEENGFNDDLTVFALGEVAQYLMHKWEIAVTSNDNLQRPESVIRKMEEYRMHLSGLFGKAGSLTLQVVAHNAGISREREHVYIADFTPSRMDEFYKESRPGIEGVTTHLGMGMGGMLDEISRAKAEPGTYTVTRSVGMDRDIIMRAANQGLSIGAAAAIGQYEGTRRSYGEDGQEEGEGRVPRLPSGAGIMKGRDNRPVNRAMPSDTNALDLDELRSRAAADQGGPNTTGGTRAYDFRDLDSAVAKYNDD